ncbi:hypothetical protein PAXRUDRAFT_825989 [Paxillus rubicundulus Ve08.2h10]|uniref:Uncharacterized protein n=1 Tax=Paxillus rubicundulus Ve08.2h10 TaxID=930991 RepID=A0A0D0DFF8_9AGAM|nr:hypothetical protein PAXRUDRAFT_825989 [Paxillus rubicundulus Ve08.2h10]
MGVNAPPRGTGYTNNRIMTARGPRASQRLAPYLATRWDGSGWWTFLCHTKHTWPVLTHL